MKHTVTITIQDTKPGSFKVEVQFDPDVDTKAPASAAVQAACAFLEMIADMNSVQAEGRP